MAIAINGSGTVTGISVGGLPDGIVDSGTLATNSVDSDELVSGSVDSAHLSGSIDATKLADGTVTSTELQYINSLSSNAQTQISAAGGSLTLISVQDVDAAEVDFEPTANSYALADYTHFLFIFTTVWSDDSGAATLYMRIGDDDGSSYKTGGYGRAMHAVDHDAAEALEGNTGSAGQWQLMDVAQDANDGVQNYAYQASVWVPSYTGATTRSFLMRASGAYGDDAGDDLRMVHCTGMQHNAADSGGYDSFRFFYSAGNVNGRISMYGFKDS